MLKYGVKLDEKNCIPKKVLVNKNKKQAEVHNMHTQQIIEW